ncbi:eCIS core domain-containing protein [Natrialba hulunbeirensis]|uniref:eCIS core domain-containing protein n=1 Tax=Natrialba hulunbeirensis TaxID=123783 RepID=UPI000677F7BF|nr:DUF4157 domain-containing protein [Natrialba hulunbeirensis]
MGRKRTRKRALKSTDADESESESQTKRHSSSSTRSKTGGPLTGTAVVDQGIGNDINALTGQPEGFDAMAGSNTPDFEPLPTGPDAQIQRALEGTDTTQDEVPNTVLDVLGQGGKPLDGPIQRALEERMDADFSSVRVHTGGKAAQAAEAIDAKAFTCGNNIVFNAGEYDTESPEGQHLLAHELAHVKQQNGGATISMMPQEGADLEIDPDPQLEREADQAAKEALSGEEPLTVNRLGTDVHIQRAAKGDALETLAMLELENEDEDGISDFRQNQNANRIAYLKEIINEFYAEAESVRDAVDDQSTVQGLVDRIEHEVGDQLQQLNEKLEDRLEDVALTDDQRQKLQQGIDTGEWVDYGTPVGSTVLGVVLSPLAGLVTGLGVAALKNRFGSLDGDIEERFKKLTKELEEQGYLTGAGEQRHY